MGQRSNYAAKKDVQINLSEEECAEGMEVQSYATVKDALAKLSGEECASGMGQMSNGATVKGAQTRSLTEECA